VSQEPPACARLRTELMLSEDHVVADSVSQRAHGFGGSRRRRVCMNSYPSEIPAEPWLKVFARGRVQRLTGFLQNRLHRSKARTSRGARHSPARSLQHRGIRRCLLLGSPDRQTTTEAGTTTSHLIRNALRLVFKWIIQRADGKPGRDRRRR
jgi:hypothetical protein